MGELITLHVPERGEPTICWPWHLRHIQTFAQHPRGASCRSCGRDVALDQQARGAGVCLYCALDEGLLEAVDQPFSGDGAPPQDQPGEAG